jgi:hypothetical protein
MTIQPAEWNSELSADEVRAMAALSIDPGFHDFSSDQVLEAYRLGREAGRAEDLERTSRGWVRR